MFDFNSILIGLIKLILIAGFVFAAISFCIKLKRDMDKDISVEALLFAIWHRRYRAVFMFILLIGMSFMFNLEQVHRPKTKLSDNTEATTMGYQEPHEITINKIEKLDREAIFTKNKEQAEAAKRAFRQLE